jgi:hypothetical protein
MLDIEPPADLRANVIARIEQPSALSSELSAFSWLRYGVPVAAAAALVLVLAVTLARRSEPIAQPRTVAQAGDVRLPGPDGAPAQQRPAGSLAQTVAISQQTRRAASTFGVASVAGAADTTTGIEPLETISPIEVAPIGQTSIAPEPIAVRPLNPITEVQIAPLNPPDRRD